MRDLLRSITPKFILEWNRKRKKDARRAALDAQKETGDHLTKVDLEKDIRALGIQIGDVILVHSSLSKIGYLANGAMSFINALKEVVGESGTILMPTSPNNEYQYDSQCNYDRFLQYVLLIYFS